MDSGELAKPAPVFEFLYNYVEKDTLHKYLRLTVIVCIYLFVRTYYTNWSKQKQVRRQLDLDKKEKEMDAERKEQKEQEKIEKLDAEAKTFGWGKTTRRNVKKQEQALTEATEALRDQYQGAYDAAEDHDIDDLLE